MRSLILIIGLLCFNIFAQENFSLPQMIKSQCMNCHGDLTMQNSPMLPGQKRDFLEFELFNFRDYVRSDETMNQVMEDFSDQEVKEIAAYISSLSICDAQALIDEHPDANITNGEKIFQNSCFKCHTSNTSKVGPIIHGQKTMYLENAIKSFQSTWYEPRPSRYNMKGHTDMLSDQDIKDVAAYLNEQQLCD